MQKVIVRDVEAQEQRSMVDSKFSLFKKEEEENLRYWPISNGDMLMNMYVTML